MWVGGVLTCWQVGGGRQGSQQGSDSQGPGALRRGPAGMRCPVWAGYPTWAQPQDEAWAPLQAVPAVGPGAQQEHSAASCSRGNRARRAAFHLQVDPRRSAQACVWSPRHPPHQQPPYVQPGDGQPGGECLACDLDVHTLPGTTEPGHAVTTRGTCNRALPRGRPQSRWAAGRGGRCSPRGFCSPVSWGWARGLGKAGEGAGDGQGRGPVSTGVLGPSSSPGLAWRVGEAAGRSLFGASGA